MKLRNLLLSCLIAIGFNSNAFAVMVNWTDWMSSSNTNGFTAQGQIMSNGVTIGVTYNNPQGVLDLYQGPTDYWAQGVFGANGRNAATSPYTSTATNGASNIPTGNDIIRLNRAGTQTLTFSQAIGNPFFSYVSLNGNGYAFDQDFEILSFGGAGGDIDGSGANDRGYWGFGTSSKEIVDIGGGVLEYRLIGTGEPHGTLRFTGTFDTVSWRSLNPENWNGFTVGVQGTAAQVFCDQFPNDPSCNPNTVPEPTTIALLGLGLAGLGYRRKRHKS